MIFSIPPRLAIALLALPVALTAVWAVSEADEYRVHCRDLDAATAANAECDLEVGRMTASIHTKLAITKEYVAGRITLRAAARRFLDLSGDEKTLANLRLLAPTADDDEERCAVSVVLYLENGANGKPEGLAAHRRAVAELAREYGGSDARHSAP